MKEDYKQETLEFLKKICDVFGQEVADQYKCQVDCQCYPVELEDGKSAIQMKFTIVEPIEK